MCINFLRLSWLTFGILVLLGESEPRYKLDLTCSEYCWQVEGPSIGEYHTFVASQIIQYGTPLGAWPAKGRPYRVRASCGCLGPLSPWTMWSVWDPLLGDVDYDCVVGAPDLTELGRRFATRCEDAP